MAQPDNFNLTHPSPYAIYLPAVNTTYPKIVDDELPSNRPVPSGFTLDDLAFWSGNSQYWNHKYVLHSIGGYDVELRREDMDHQLARRTLRLRDDPRHASLGHVRFWRGLSLSQLLGTTVAEHDAGKLEVN